MSSYSAPNHSAAQIAGRSSHAAGSHPRPSSFLDSPRRVAIAGDWHADTDFGQAAIQVAAHRDAGVIVHLGDFGYNFYDRFLDGLDSTLDHYGLTLGFVDGNHENFDRLYEFPIAANGLRYLRNRIVHLPRGFRWQWDAVSQFLARCATAIPPT